MDYVAIEKFRRVTGLDAGAKRRRIAEITAAMDTATHTPPARAAGMLPAIWAARISLDWGCRPVVGR